MRTFDQDLMDQVRAERVSMTDAVTYATNPHDFKLAMQTTAPAPPEPSSAPAE